MISILIYISIFIALIGIKAFVYWLYKKHEKKIINNSVNSIIDGNIYFISAYFLFCAPDWCSIGFMFGIMFISTGFRWIIYDLIYNWINKYKWNHYGLSAWQDRQLKKLGKYHMTPKFVLLISGLILILLSIR